MQLAISPDAALFSRARALRRRAGYAGRWDAPPTCSLSRSTLRSRARGLVPSRTTPASSSLSLVTSLPFAHARHCRAVAEPDAEAEAAQHVAPCSLGRRPPTGTRPPRALPHCSTWPCVPLLMLLSHPGTHHPFARQPMRRTSSKSRRPMPGALSPPSRASRAASTRRATSRRPSRASAAQAAAAARGHTPSAAAARGHTPSSAADGV